MDNESNFPLLIKYNKTGETVVVQTPQQIRSGEGFSVLKCKYQQTNTCPSELVTHLTEYLHDRFITNTDYKSLALVITNWLLDNEVTLVKRPSGNQSQVPVQVS